jgi:cell fate regulator YaaT (PSP1 superfamily)
MSHLEYLVNHGLAGDFGRFRAAAPLELRRGARVVVRSHRGLESGQVLRPATAGLAVFLPNTTVGVLLRPATDDDVTASRRCETRGQEICARGRELAESLSLPVELVDVEVLLDGEHAVLHLLRPEDCDIRPLVSALSRETELHILVAEMGGAPEAEAEPEEAGCGSCGSEGGSCGSGGCGSGGCGSCKPKKKPAADDAARFAALREQMERRVSLH